MQTKKILISGLVLMSMLSSQTFAATPEQALPNLTLEKAIQLALYQDPEVVLMDEKIALAEKELVQVNANTEYLKTVTTYDKASYVNNRKLYLLTPVKKVHSVDAIKRQKETLVNGIKVNVMTQYYNVQSKMEQLEDAKRSLDVLNREIEAKRKELSLGKITQLDFNGYEVKLLEMENTINKATVDLQVSYMEFASLVNQKLDYKFTPTPIETGVQKYEIKDLGEILKNELTKNNDLLSKQAAINEMEIEIKINLDSDYEIGNTDSATNVLQNDLKAANKDLASIKSNIEMNLNVDYLKLQSSYENTRVLKSALELAQNDYRVAEVKHSVGNISLLDFLSKKEALDKAESDYSSAVSTYHTDIEKFKENHFIQ